MHGDLITLCATFILTVAHKHIAPANNHKIWMRQYREMLQNGCMSLRKFMMENGADSREIYVYGALLYWWFYLRSF